MNAPKHPDLQRYLDGEGRSGERARVEAHLATCPDCAAEVHGFRALIEGLRGAFSLLFSGSVGALVGAFDRAVSLLTAVVALREAAGQALLPLAPLGRSLEVLLSQPELRVGLSVALVLTTALWWMLNHRPVGGRGRMNDVPAFF